MSNDAFAGFLKLWLTPASREPVQSSETDAYLQYLSENESLEPDTTRVAVGQVDGYRSDVFGRRIFDMDVFGRNISVSGGDLFTPEATAWLGQTA
jgi:hypothetical protein